MPRIQPVQIEAAEPKTAELLSAVKKKLGMVPNLISTMAHSTATANAYLGFSQVLAGGQLPARLREQIALTVGQANECGYCAGSACDGGRSKNQRRSRVRLQTGRSTRQGFRRRC